MIQVNGENLNNFEQKTVLEMLTELHYEKTRIAVEKNGEILPKSRYETEILQENDVLEVVSFVGGG